jgi:ABC-type lipoprotein export system ATPase subunit
MDFLTAHGLHKSYRMGGRDIEVLRGVDLRIHKGEALVIRGASGAGKSTLLHLLGALDVPTAGSVHLDSQNMYAMSASRRTRLRNEKIGFVFQAYNLLPELDALEIVCIPSWVAGRPDQAMSDRGRSLLDAVGLGDRLEHRPSELSGGEQQRVAIARALMNQPSLLLADEPTGNLDSKTGESILDLLWQMRESHGITLVMVTHDEHVAKRGERVLEIADGRVFS